MKKILAFIALSFITAQSARAQVSALPGQAASEFAGGIQRGIYLIRPTDPFQNQQCGMLDAKFFAPVTLTEAQRVLTPCLGAISQKYGVTVKARAGSLTSSAKQSPVLFLDVTQALAITHPLIRDLNYGLSRRSGHILGIAAQLYVPGHGMSLPAINASAR